MFCEKFTIIRHHTECSFRMKKWSSARLRYGTPEDYVPQPGHVPQPGDDTDAMYDYIGPNYFSTMGIPLIAGREFTESDTAESPKVCVINQKLAQRSFAGRNPIGLHITHGGGKLYTDPPMEIVGVVANSKWDDARSDIDPFLYMPYSQDKNLGHLAFYIRTERDQAPMAASLRSLIQRLDPNLPVNNLGTLEEQVAAEITGHSQTSSGGNGYRVTSPGRAVSEDERWMERSWGQ